MLSAIIAGALLSVIVISLWKTLNHRAIRDHQRRLETAIIALYNYNAVVRHMPPRVIRTQTGKPLGSWRMALVPYLPSPSFVDLADIDTAITRGYDGNGINAAFVDHGMSRNDQLETLVWFIDKMERQYTREPVVGIMDVRTAWSLR